MVANILNRLKGGLNGYLSAGITSVLRKFQMEPEMTLFFPIGFIKISKSALASGRYTLQITPLSSCH